MASVRKRRSSTSVSCTKSTDQRTGTALAHITLHAIGRIPDVAVEGRGGKTRTGGLRHELDGEVGLLLVAMQPGDGCLLGVRAET
ncbi:MAG TPA: hypothetical protein P5114_04535 [Hyphomicrobiaceae bacterium]|nr:hypothetical protein [Hyphomicrobiaceae bacterium]